MFQNEFLYIHDSDFFYDELNLSLISEQISLVTVPFEIIILKLCMIIELLSVIVILIIANSWFFNNYAIHL